MKVSRATPPASALLLGLLKNAPLVAGYGWGRNDTPKFCDPVSHGMVFWDSYMLTAVAPTKRAIML